ncbi:hypothetical protein V1478_003119 [Vespula squamosa]|uniref:Uncharacterized protein n=1 Tax=Vespula squamosa TaxID=30214 RepID=A0ABD2BS92_VESSQ
MVRSSEQTLNASDDGKQRPPGRWEEEQTQERRDYTRSTEESLSFRENLKDVYVNISRLIGMSSAKQIYKVYLFFHGKILRTLQYATDSQPHARVARMGPVFQVNQSLDRSVPQLVTFLYNYKYDEEGRGREFEEKWPKNPSHLGHRDFIGNVRNVNKEDWSNKVPGGTLHVLQHINASQPSDSMKFSKETCCDGRDDGVALSISTIANCLTKGQRRNLPTTPLKSVLPD